MAKTRSRILIFKTVRRMDEQHAMVKMTGSLSYRHWRPVEGKGAKACRVLTVVRILPGLGEETARQKTPMPGEGLSGAAGEADQNIEEPGRLRHQIQKQSRWTANVLA
jgi:hypothetical protein